MDIKEVLGNFNVQTSSLKPLKDEKSGLYAFLATNYDISNLANKIYATKSAKLNLLSLKRNGMAI